ncbi:MAG: hypothetical protein H7Y04_14340 [Verrucomicrobia bacterium]|nr:hypothetical protein [Cytophagales bacterium]
MQPSNRLSPQQSSIPVTDNIWQIADEQKNRMQQLLSQREQMKVESDDLRKKISDHLSSIRAGK